MRNGIIKGFSTWGKNEKRQFTADLVENPDDFLQDIKNLDHPVTEVQELFDQFSENSVSNFILPYSIAPNFLVNDKLYHVPMVTEESSVVAAASASARFWSERGGFHTKVTGTKKNGQIFFRWKGDQEILFSKTADLKKYLTGNIDHLTKNMEKRGGGITGMELTDMSGEISNLYRLMVFFETADSMGANFINSCLEEMASLLVKYIPENINDPSTGPPEIIMAILSNYNPDCLVEAEVRCHVNDLDSLFEGMEGRQFATKFKTAVDIASIDVYRAVTHNKGIMNGAEAVIVATGNDFRAIEAAVHAYASRTGRYNSLSYVKLINDEFIFGLRMPLAVGTIGGITKLHPMTKWSYKILGNPDAVTLMQIIAAAALASNFSAVRALITRGIQSGHMKMHLNNILKSLNASKEESDKAFEHFKNKTVSYSKVRELLIRLRT